MSLRRALKTATRHEHEALEASALLHDMAAGQLELRGYVAWLRGLAAIVRVTEQKLAATEPTSPVAQLGAACLRASPLLAQDLAYFDRIGRGAAAAIEPTIALLDELRKRPTEAPEWLGVLYVLEGSTLGGKRLRKVLAEQHSLEDQGLAYLSAYGPEARERWDAFCVRLDDLQLDDEARARAVEGARRFFVGLRHISEASLPLDLADPPRAHHVNPDAGRHSVASDPREILCALEAEAATWAKFPYLEHRFGDRGRRFSRSDSAWLVTLCDLGESAAMRHVDWLGGLLSVRGMPTYFIEHQLFTLQRRLCAAIPERAENYAKLAQLAGKLKDRRLDAVPDFDGCVESFPRANAVPSLGTTFAAALADERNGVNGALEAVQTWVAQSELFDDEACRGSRAWVEASRAA